MKNTTAIHVVLDRSGSMSRVRSDVIGGFNTFLKEQKAEPGKATISLAQFDSVYEVVYESQPLSKAPDLDEKTYVPRASTALLDAIGRTINNVSAELKKLTLGQRPDKVLFLIMTDGLENASTEFKKDEIKRLIELNEKELDWKFVFIGASLDSMAEARDMGLASGNMMRSTLDSHEGVAASYKVMSRGTSDYRSKSLSSAKKDDFFDKQGRKQSSSSRSRNT